MTHEEASLILVDRFAERLDAVTAARVDDHVAACDVCVGALETLRVLRGSSGSGAGTDRSPHLPIERIAELALDFAREGRADGGPDVAHLSTCPTCAAEVDACRASVAEARTGLSVAAGAGRRRLRPFFPSALAAALVVAVLGYPAYIGLVELPRARRQAEAAWASAARSQSEASSLREAIEKERAAAPTPDKGEIVLALYLDATRGAQGRTPAMELQPGARVVTILLEPVVPRAAAESEPLRFEIRDREGRVVWSSETTAGAIRDRHGWTDRLLTLLVPASALSPGGYTLSLGRLGQAGAGNLIEAPFEIAAPAEEGSPRR